VLGARTALLGTEALRNHLATILSHNPARLLIVSAYVTRLGVEWLEQSLGDNAVECDIVARWSPNDLIVGASDVEACAIAHTKGWRFHVLRDLHAKVALIDDTYLIVGSANLTGTGMSLVPASNREFGIAAVAAPDDVRAIGGLLSDAVLITPKLLEEVRNWVMENKANDVGAIPQFPFALQQKLSAIPTRLYTADLPWLTYDRFVSLRRGESEMDDDHLSYLHDLALFGLEQGLTPHDEAIAAINNAAIKSRFWLWLVEAVRTQHNGEVWYGTLSALLHNALLDDPRPYRKDVKMLVTNLFSYAEKTADVLKADRPNWSMRLTHVAAT
jgi:PLD-like domain